MIPSFAVGAYPGCLPDLKLSASEARFASVTGKLAGVSCKATCTGKIVASDDVYGAKRCLPEHLPSRIHWGGRCKLRAISC